MRDKSIKDIFMQNTIHVKKVAQLSVVFLLPAILIVIALWLPFGFSSVGLIEEWALLGLYTQHGVIFVAKTSNILALHALRPLMIFPLSLAYFFDPNSFFYWQMFAIFSLIIKGAAASYLIWIATGSRSMAALMGVMVLLYPADTMQIPLRPLQINWAIALSLLASSCLIAAYHRKGIKSFAFGLVAPALLIAAISMYETACVLILLPFFIFFVRDGIKESIRKLRSRLDLLLLWFFALGWYAAYAMVVSAQITTYQSKITGGKSVVDILIGSLPKLFSVGLLRGLLGGWFDALRMTMAEFSSYGYCYLAIGALCVGSLLFLIAKKENRDIPKVVFFKRTLRLGMTGILLLCLGYAPFLLATSHLVISQRTFLFATPGAAMVWIAVLMLISLGSQWLFRLLALMLIFIGLGAQLYQAHHYAKISDTQRYLLKNIVENFDGNLNKKTLVIFDESNQLDRTWMFLKENLSSALTYFYRKDIGAIQICYLPTNEWRVPDDLNRMGTCVRGKNGLLLRSSTNTPVSGPGYVASAPQPDIKLTKDQMVSITIKPDGSISSDLQKNDRRFLQQDKDLTAVRYRNILAPQKSYLDLSNLWRKHDERYRWSFGNWWSLELPIKGSGWREAEWDVNYFYHQASAWKTQEKATLMFDLVPIQKPYILKGKFGIILNKKIHDSIQLRLNNKLLSLKLGEDGSFMATIPPDTLVSGVNTLEFNSHVDPHYFGLSVKLNWYEVVPAEGVT